MHAWGSLRGVGWVGKRKGKGGKGVHPCLLFMKAAAVESSSVRESRNSGLTQLNIIYIQCEFLTAQI